MDRPIDAVKDSLLRLGITQRTVAAEVQRRFGRSSSVSMVNKVVNGRAKSSYVTAAIEALLTKARDPQRRRVGVCLGCRQVRALSALGLLPAHPAPGSQTTCRGSGYPPSHPGLYRK